MTVTVKQIIGLVCSHFGISEVALTSSCREQQIARPRQVAMWLARECTEKSLPQLGRCFGGFDHTSVLYSVGRIEEIVSFNPEFKGIVEGLKRKLEKMPPPQPKQRNQARIARAATDFITVSRQVEAGKDQLERANARGQQEMAFKILRREVEAS